MAYSFDHGSFLVVHSGGAAAAHDSAASATSASAWHAWKIHGSFCTEECL